MGYRDNYFKDEYNKSNYGWYTCVRCGKKLRKGDVDIDHILPQSMGGGHSADNLQCMCRHCNRSKGNKMDDSYNDYKHNSVRRMPNSRKEMKDLDRALEKGAVGVHQWLKKK